jgi:hypothetical protein
MSYISILRNGEEPSGREENPIFIIESTPSEVIFEIFKSDAGVIQPLAGIPSRHFDRLEIDFWDRCNHARIWGYSRQECNRGRPFYCICRHSCLSAAFFRGCAGSFSFRYS